MYKLHRKKCIISDLATAKMNATATLGDPNATHIELDWGAQDTLATYQIITLIWSVLCIIPNAILIHILSKETLRRSHLYFTLLNWSICNTVLILTTIHWTVVPLKYLSFKIWECSYSFSMTLITLTVILVTIFTYERYIKSNDFCRYLIFRFWVVVGIFAMIAFVSVFVEYIHIALVIFSVGIINLVCLVILVVKIILLFVKNHSPLEDESYSLRLTLATIYVLITSIERCFFVAGFHWVPLFEMLKIIIFADGFINLSMLIYFDQTIKTDFLDLFRTRQVRIV